MGGETFYDRSIYCCLPALQASVEHLHLTALADVWAHNPEVQEEISVDILAGGFLHVRKLNLPCYSFLLLK